MMKLVTGHGGSASFALLLALEELGGSYDIQTIDLQEFEQWSAGHRQLSPNGEAPVLVFDGRAMDHALLALYYLAEVFPEKGLMPPEPTHCYTVHAETFILDRQIADHLAYIGWLATVPLQVREDYLHRLAARSDKPKLAGWSAVWRDAVPAEHRIADAQAKVIQGVERVSRLLGADEWMVGNRFSIADIVVFALLRQIPDIMPDCRSLEESTPLAAWFARMAERPSAQRALERLGKAGLYGVFKPPVYLD